MRFIQFQVTMPDKSKIIHEIWDMDYFDACEEIQKLFPKAKKIEPIFGLSQVKVK